MIQTIQTGLARALVRIAILAAQPDLADELRKALGGGGGPRPTVPK